MNEYVLIDIKEDVSLMEAVRLRKAEMIAFIESRMKEIQMPNETLMAIDGEKGGDIYGYDVCNCIYSGYNCHSCWCSNTAKQTYFCVWKLWKRI